MGTHSEVQDGRDRLEEFRRRHCQGVVALVFTDLVGSTRLKQRLGDARAGALIADHHEVIRECLRREPDGREISTAGDSFFLAFSRPSSAARFALLAQARVRVFARASGEPLRDRIGIHVGEVAIEGAGDDLHGLQVDTASRVMGLAAGDQILLTRFAFDSARQALTGEGLAGIGTLSWLNHGLYALRGVEEPLEICEVGEIGAAALAPPPDGDKGRRAVQSVNDPVPGWRPALGQRIPNTGWTLERKLGEGGFGEVWLAEHANLRRRQVFKFCFEAERARSLRREVTLFRLLQERVGHHPNIVGVRDVYFDEPPFYVGMDFVDGADLGRWWEEKTGEVPMTVRLGIVIQIADALQAAHDAGVIHRDVKPSNILVADGDTECPRALLTDFGIGQLTSEGALHGVTRAGFTMTMMPSDSPTQAGTQLYMAPELLGGKPASIRSDIYALGVILFQLVVGDLRVPVTTDWRLRVTDPLLQEDLARCFAGDPADRFPSAGELAERLRTLDERRAEQDREKAKQAARERAAYRRGLVRAGLAGLAVLAVIGTLAVVAWRETARAERNFSAAQKVADDLMAITQRVVAGGEEVTGDRLGRRLAGSAVSNYRGFLADSPRDQTLRLNLARACRSQAEILAADSDAKSAARASLEESVALAREVLQRSPDSAEARSTLADALAVVAYDNRFGAEEAVRSAAAREALSLRRAGASAAPRSAAAQVALAALLRKGAAATEDPAQRRAMFNDEVAALDRALALTPEPDRTGIRTALSRGFENLAHEAGPAGAAPYFQRALEALGEPSAASSPSGVAGLRLGVLTRAAEAASRAGDPESRAAVAAQLERELAAFATLTHSGEDLSAAKRAEANARVAWALVAPHDPRAGVEAERAIAVLRSISVRGIDFDLEELDDAWNAAMVLALARGDAGEAIRRAREAAEFWNDSGDDPYLAAASWRRAAVIAAALGRDPGFAQGEAERTQRELERFSDDEALYLAWMLTGYADAFGSGFSGATEFRRISAGILAGLAERGARFAAADLAGFPGSDPSLTDLLGRLRDAGSAPAEPPVVEANAPQSVLAAARRGLAFSVRGRVQACQWAPSKNVLRVFFVDVPATEFFLLMSGEDRFALEQRIGGDIERRLPGALIRAKVFPEWEGGNQGFALRFRALDGVAEFEPGPAPEGTVAPEPAAPLVSARDDAALRHLLGREVCVEGAVATVRPSRTGAVTTIALEGVGPEGFAAVYFPAEESALRAALGGDPALVLPGRLVRLRGRLESYRGRPQLVLKQSGQIELLNAGSAPATTPLLAATDTARLRELAGQRVTVEGTLATAAWSPSGGVLTAEFRDAPTDGLRMVVFRMYGAKLTQSLGGELPAVLPGCRVRVAGMVKLYGADRHPEIAVDDATQIAILEPARAGGPPP